MFDMLTQNRLHVIFTRSLANEGGVFNVEAFHPFKYTLTMKIFYHSAVPATFL